VSCAKLGKNKLIEAHDSCDQDLQDANVSKSLEQSFPWDRVHCLSKVNKETEEFQRVVPSLVNDGLECENMVNGLLLQSEPCLSFTLKMSPLELFK